MVRQNKQDLFFIGTIIAFAIIAMTSFSACSTTKMTSKVHVVDVAKKDSVNVKSTDSHIEVDASTIRLTDSVSNTTIREIVTIYEVVYDTVGMPVLLPSGEPMTYKKQVNDYHFERGDSLKIVSVCDSKLTVDSAAIDSASVQVSDSTVVITEKSYSRKTKSLASLIVLLLSVGGVLLVAKLLLDKISG